MVLAVLPADEKHTSARALYLSPPFDPDADQPWENYATDTMELCFSGMYCMISMTASVMRMPQRERGINAPSLEASSIRILEKSANEYFKAFSELRPLGFDVEIKLTPKAMPKAGGGA